MRPSAERPAHRVAHVLRSDYVTLWRTCIDGRGNKPSKMRDFFSSPWQWADDGGCQFGGLRLRQCMDRFASALLLGPLLLLGARWQDELAMAANTGGCTAFFCVDYFRPQVPAPSDRKIGYNLPTTD